MSHLRQTSPGLTFKFNYFTLPPYPNTDFRLGGKGCTQREVEPLLKVKSKKLQTAEDGKEPGRIKREVPRLGRGRQTRGEPAPKGGVHGSKQTDLIPTAQGKSDERVKSASVSGVAPKWGSVKSQGSEDRSLLSEAGQPEGPGPRRTWRPWRQRGEGEDRMEPAGWTLVRCPSDQTGHSVAALWTARRGLATRGPLRAAAALTASTPRAPEGPARRGATGRGAGGQPSRARADAQPPPSRSLYLGLQPRWRPCQAGAGTAEVRGRHVLLM